MTVFFGFNVIFDFGLLSPATYIRQRDWMCAFNVPFTYKICCAEMTSLVRSYRSEGIPLLLHYVLTEGYAYIFLIFFCDYLYC